MLLHPERYRRLIRRHGEPVIWYRAVPAAQVARRGEGEVTNEALQPRGGAAKAPPSPDGARVSANGWVYQRQTLAPGVLAWIFDEQIRWNEGETGVSEEGSAQIVWMPDELAVSRPDKLVRVRSERPARERVVVPPSGTRLPLAHELTFAVDNLESLSPNGEVREWVRGQDWIGSGSLEIGPFVTWLNLDRPEPGSELSVGSRFFPAFYFTGEEETSRRRSRFIDNRLNGSVTGAIGEGYLPRHSTLTLTHPDAQWAAH